MEIKTPSSSILVPILSTFGIIGGLIMALSEPVTGFIVVALSMTIPVVLSITGIKDFVTGDDYGYEVQDLQSRLLFWEAVSLLAFVPLIFPGLQLILGTLILIFIGLIIYERTDGTPLSGDETVKITYMLTIAVLFFALYIVPEFLILGIGAAASMFLWDLIPQRTKERWL